MNRQLCRNTLEIHLGYSFETYGMSYFHSSTSEQCTTYLCYHTGSSHLVNSVLLQPEFEMFPQPRQGSYITMWQNNRKNQGTDGSQCSAICLRTYLSTLTLCAGTVLQKRLCNIGNNNLQQQQSTNITNGIKYCAESTYLIHVWKTIIQLFGFCITLYNIFVEKSLLLSYFLKQIDNKVYQK